MMAPASPRRRRPRLLAAYLVAASLALANVGCAGWADTPDLRTASDQSDADRLAQVRLELASGYFSMGQAPTALDEVKRALAIKPDSAEALNLRGLIYGHMGQAALAEESFRRALRSAPQAADVMHNYAWFLCQQGRWQEGDAWFGAAIDRTAPRDAARSWRARGVCLGHARRLEMAAQALAQADSIEPGHPVTTHHLAQTLLALGRPELARAKLEPVLQQAANPSETDLWLAVRLAHRVGDEQGLQRWADLLRTRHPSSAAATRVARGLYDE